MKSQWECFLQNVGEWHGSFTGFSVQGKELDTTPSVVHIDRRSDQHVHFSLRRNSPTHRDIEFDMHGTLSRDVLFFENGAFSQGSMQLSPFGAFGAEFGLMDGNRRLRLVQMFENRALQNLTLIREQRAETDAPERPPLTIDDVVGEWQGEALTLYPDWRSPDSYPTTLTIGRDGDRVKQELRFGQGEAECRLASNARIISLENGNATNSAALFFDQGAMPIQILLLPDGASCNCPVQIKPGQPFVLELGWLLQADLRQRIIRSYDHTGEWTSLTLVTEHKTVNGSDRG